MTDSMIPESTLGDRSADTVVYGGVVYDGTGTPAVSSDLAFKGDTIVAIGPDLRERFPFAQAFDARGLAVSPGFIDIHTHSDLSVLANREMKSAIHQGVTTELAGNCGIAMGLIRPDSEAFKQEMSWLEREGISISWTRMSGYFERLEADGVSCNLGCLAGHGTIRKGVMGFAERAPDAAEMSAMRTAVENAMADGAFGLSTGLEYLPGGYAKLDEICFLAEEAHAAGGFYASHLRSEGDEFLEAVDEAIAVGERTGIPVQLSHHKAEGRANWGKVKRTLARMQDARASGLDVMTDQYPYTAFMTGLTLILLPAWARNGSPDEVLARLKDTQTRERVERDIEAANLDYDAIRIGVARGRTEVQGLTLAQLGRREGVSPASAAIDLLIAENAWVGAANFALSEEDVELVLKDSHTMIGSDGVATSPGAPERPHPRSYGTFPRVLSRYVRDRGILSLPEAIRRMTSLPASRLKLTDRGRLAPGCKADVTVFRAESIQDCATFDDPHQFPAGIEFVFVNGRLTIDKGRHTGARSGVALRRA